MLLFPFPSDQLSGNIVQDNSLNIACLEIQSYSLLKEKGQLGDPGMDGRIILKWILNILSRA
jgi:hypothetical protein